MDHTGELADLFNIALRGRVGTLAELAEITGRTEAETETDIDRLESLGFLRHRDGALIYRRPDTTVADVTRRILARLSHDLDSTVTRTQDALGALPRLLQAWDHGDIDSHNLPIELVHGPLSATEMWDRHTARGVPQSSLVCLPDASHIFAVHHEQQTPSFWAENPGPDRDIRLLISTKDATSSIGRDRVVLELAAGSQVRMHPNPPSYFWITDHETVGIPLAWGEGWPSSLMAVSSPALAATLTWIYDRLWDEAVPVTGTAHPWDPMLKLMSAGMTMESAAHALAMTPRTGRRRVADAMAHYGASNHFSLGAAWRAASTA